MNERLEVEIVDIPQNNIQQMIGKIWDWQKAAMTRQKIRKVVAEKNATYLEVF